MQVAEERGLPGAIRVDNGPEFASKLLDQRAYLNGVKMIKKQRRPERHKMSFCYADRNCTKPSCTIT